METSRHRLTSEHGNFIDVVETPDILTIKTGPQITYENLSPLIEAYDSLVKARFVFEAGEIVGEEVDKRCSRVLGLCDTIQEAAVESLASYQYCAGLSSPHLPTSYMTFPACRKQTILSSSKGI